MEFIGTKRPWSLSKKWFKKRASCAWIEIRSEDGKVLAEAKGKHHGIPNEECEANAQLISKAPEMLEMLNHVKEAINQMSFDQLELMYNDLEELIQEATT